MTQFSIICSLAAIASGTTITQIKSDGDELQITLTEEIVSELTSMTNFMRLVNSVRVPEESQGHTSCYEASCDRPTSCAPINTLIDSYESFFAMYDFDESGCLEICELQWVFDCYCLPSNCFSEDAGSLL